MLADLFKLQALALRAEAYPPELARTATRIIAAFAGDEPERPGFDDSLSFACGIPGSVAHTDSERFEFVVARAVRAPTDATFARAVPVLLDGIVEDSMRPTLEWDRARRRALPPPYSAAFVHVQLFGALYSNAHPAYGHSERQLSFLLRVFYGPLPDLREALATRANPAELDGFVTPEGMTVNRTWASPFSDMELEQLLDQMTTLRTHRLPRSIEAWSALLAHECPWSDAR